MIHIVSTEKTNPHACSSHSYQEQPGAALFISFFAVDTAGDDLKRRQRRFTAIYNRTRQTGTFTSLPSPKLEVGLFFFFFTGLLTGNVRSDITRWQRETSPSLPGPQSSGAARRQKLQAPCTTMAEPDWWRPYKTLPRRGGAKDR